MRLGQMYQIIVYRALAELRSEATRTYAGYLWWIIQPLISLGVYYVAFKYILATRRENFALFLFTGIVLWQWFALTIQRSATSLTTSRNLMQQVNMHKVVFPMSTVMINTIKFSVTFSLLIVVLLLAGYSVSWAWAGLGPLLGLLLLLIVGLSCGAAAISPFVPDFQLMLGTLLQLLFFVSGVFFDLSQLPAGLRRYLQLNPMAVLIENFRRVLLDGQWPQWQGLLLPMAEASAFTVVALLLLHRFNKVYPKLS